MRSPGRATAGASRSRGRRPRMISCFSKGCARQVAAKSNASSCRMLPTCACHAPRPTRQSRSALNVQFLARSAPSRFDQHREFPQFGGSGGCRRAPETARARSTTSRWRPSSRRRADPPQTRRRAACRTRRRWLGRVPFRVPMRRAKSTKLEGTCPAAKLNPRQRGRDIVMRQICSRSSRLSSSACGG